MFCCKHNNTITAVVAPQLATSVEIQEKDKRKRELEERPIIENLCSRYLSKPQLPLPYQDRFGNLCADPNRNYLMGHIGLRYESLQKEKKDLVDLLNIITLIVCSYLYFGMLIWWFQMRQIRV